MHCTPVTDIKYKFFHLQTTFATFYQVSLTFMKLSYTMLTERNCISDKKHSCKYRMLIIQTEKGREFDLYIFNSS